MMDYELRIKNWKTIAALAAIVLIGWVGLVIMKSSLEKETEVVVSEGAGVYIIADILKKEGVIDNKFVFVTYTLVTGNEKKLQAGKYIFRPGITIPIIVHSMARGLAESDDVEITIPEGTNIWGIDKILTNASLTEGGEFARIAIGNEGRLFPDTYRLRNDQRPTTNNQQLAEELKEKAADNFNKQTSGLLDELSTEKQKTVIIIASILEKEAKTESDMRLVAGVIKNRLEKGMLLQVDATVAYGACLRNIEMSKYRSVGHCDVSQVGVGEEIKIDGLYNTYIHAGLPPGPISNPGLKAILAALNPADTNFLYYLSTRDGGQVIFSKTAAEHMANRRKYLGL